LNSSQLLDKNTKSFQIKKYKIQDENNQTLGLIKFKTGFRGEEYRLVEPGGSILVKIRPESLFGKSYFIEDNSKKILGIAEDWDSFYTLENKIGDRILNGEIRDYPTRFEITDENENLVASFSMVKTGSKIQKLFGNWNDQFVLHLHGQSTDRTILLGFFVFVYYRTLNNESLNLKDAVDAGTHGGFST
jgi:hypothetical protein